MPVCNEDISSKPPEISVELDFTLELSHELNMKGSINNVDLNKVLNFIINSQILFIKFKNIMCYSKNQENS